MRSGCCGRVLDRGGTVGKSTEKSSTNSSQKNESEEEKLPKCRTATLCPKKRSRRCRAGDWAARSRGQVAAAAWVEVVSAVAATAT